MIIAANQIYGVSAKCVDGFEAQADDLLFDDRSWNVTCVVMRVGGWLKRRRVLVTPNDLDSMEWAAGRLGLRLSGPQLRAAPTLESNPPVAMQKSRELELVAWDAYWSGVLDGPLGLGGDPHLRNTRAVTGHHVFGLDADAGYVDDFVIDDREWRIRYLVVRLGRRRSANRVVIEPRWVEAIVWEDRGVHIHLPKAQIEHGRTFVAEDFAAIT